MKKKVECEHNVHNLAPLTKEARESLIAFDINDALRVAEFANKLAVPLEELDRMSFEEVLCYTHNVGKHSQSQLASLFLYIKRRHKAMRAAHRFDNTKPKPQYSLKKTYEAKLGYTIQHVNRVIKAEAERRRLVLDEDGRLLLQDEQAKRDEAKANRQAHARAEAQKREQKKKDEHNELLRFRKEAAEARLAKPSAAESQAVMPLPQPKPQTVPPVVDFHTITSLDDRRVTERDRYFFQLGLEAAKVARRNASFAGNEAALIEMTAAQAGV